MTPTSVPGESQSPSIPSDDELLRLDIKRIIVAVCELGIDPASIADDAVLVGTDSTLITDSLDGLQLAVTIGKRFGVRIRDGKHARRVMASVDALATFIAAHR